MINEAQRAFLNRVLGEEAASQLLLRAEQASKSLETGGVAFKVKPSVAEVERALRAALIELVAEKAAQHPSARYTRDAIELLHRGGLLHAPEDEALQRAEKAEAERAARSPARPYVDALLGKRPVDDHR